MLCGLQNVFDGAGCKGAAVLDFVVRSGFGIGEGFMARALPIVWGGFAIHTASVVEPVGKAEGILECHVAE